MSDIVAGKVYLLEADGSYVGTVTISENEICRLFVLPQHQHNGDYLCFDVMKKQYN